MDGWTVASLMIISFALGAVGMSMIIRHWLFKYNDVTPKKKS